MVERQQRGVSVRVSLSTCMDALLSCYIKTALYYGTSLRVSGILVLVVCVFCVGWNLRVRLPGKASSLVIAKLVQNVPVPAATALKITDETLSSPLGPNE